MKLLLLFLLFSTASFSQGAFRLFFQGETFYKQTYIVFTDSTTDDVDMCCDVVKIGGANANDIWTSIDDVPYAFNFFSPLSSDKIIPLGVAAASISPYYVIGVDETQGREFCLQIFDLQNGSVHSLPYPFYGEIFPGRFLLFVEYPLSVSVTDGCDSSLVTIDNDEFTGEYLVNSFEGDLIFLPGNSQSLYLPDGQYDITVLVDDETCQETVEFEVSPVMIEASLHVPYTILSTQDPVIIPTLVLDSPVDEYFWDFGDGSPFLYNDHNPVHFYSEEGAYILRVVLRKGFCTKELTETITIEKFSFIEELQIKARKKPELEYGIDGRLQRKIK
jgi:hypothetical protein